MWTTQNYYSYTEQLLFGTLHFTRVLYTFFYNYYYLIIKLLFWKQKRTIGSYTNKKYFWVVTVRVFFQRFYYLMKPWHFERFFLEKRPWKRFSTNILIRAEMNPLHKHKIMSVGYQVKQILKSRSWTHVYAGSRTDFRDKKSSDFSGEIFRERNFCPRTAFSGKKFVRF